MNIITLVYVSHAIKHMPNDELRDMLISARKKNKRLEITGMLLYRDQSFIQVLEGDPDKVSQLYKTIKQDPRHENVTLVYSEPITERAFNTWSMGFYLLDDLSLKKWKVSQIFCQIQP